MTRLPLRLHPRPCRTLALRLLASPLARDLRRDGALLLGCLLVLSLALVLALLSDGYYMTWHGPMPLPEPDAFTLVPDSCGDYCGTDAGIVTGG